MKITLTEDQQQYVKDNYLTMSSYQMGKEIKMSYIKVNQNLLRMGIKSPFNNKRKTLRLASVETDIFNDSLHSDYYYS